MLTYLSYYKLTIVMKKPNTAVFRVIYLLFVLFFISPNLQASSISNTNNTYSPNTFTPPNCKAPDLLIINPLSDRRLSISWRASNATAYELQVSINRNNASYYYVTAPNTALFVNLDRPLREGDLIGVCVRSTCDKTTPYTDIARNGDLTICEEQIYRRAIATVEPVYRADIDCESSCPSISLKKLDALNDPDCPIDRESLVHIYYDLGEFCTHCLAGLPNGAELTCDILVDCLGQLTRYSSNRITMCDDNTFPKTQATFIQTDIIQIYPNPIYAEGVMSYHLKNDGLVHLQIFSSSGIQLLEQVVHQTAGSQSLPIKLDNLPNGVFYYHLSMNQKNYQGKLIKGQ